MIYDLYSLLQNVSMSITRPVSLVISRFVPSISIVCIPSGVIARRALFSLSYIYIIPYFPRFVKYFFKKFFQKVMPKLHNDYIENDISDISIIKTNKCS